MLSVLDTLPEGVELEEIRGESNLSGMGPITISKDGAVSGGNSVYQITGTQQNREVRLKLTRADAQNGTKLDAGVYTLVVKCKVSKEKLDPYAAGETYSFPESCGGDERQRKHGKHRPDTAMDRGYRRK